MSEPIVLGAFPGAPATPALCSLEVELVPLDLLTQWRRCGMIADFVGDYMAYAFGRRDVARTALSTIVNELVENVAKFSADVRETGRVTLRHLGSVLVLEATNVADAPAVARLEAAVSELARGEPEQTFARCLEQRRGLGLALVAKDYRARVGATATPLGGGMSRILLRAVIAAEEVDA